MASGWRNREGEPMAFFDDVLKGHPFTVALKGDFRAEVEYLEGWHIALDFDEGNLTPRSFEADPFAKRYASFAYPTLSSTEQEPRSRLVFVLDRPIVQPLNMRRAINAFMHLYGNSDKQCRDAARLFLGAAPAGESAWYGNVIPLAQVRRLIDEWEADMAALEARKPRKVYAKKEGEERDDNALLLYWENRLASTGKGDRNNTLNRAAYSLYQLVVLDRLDEQEVETMLRYQGRMAGLKDSEVEATMSSALRGAKKEVYGG